MAADFAEFYEQARTGCLRAVYASVGDRQQAEDLVSEAFARAWAGWAKVSRHPAPRAWIVRTALNTRVSWWRRRRHEVAWTGQDPAAEAGAGAGVDERAMAALRALPARQRQVIALRIFLERFRGLDAGIGGRGRDRPVQREARTGPVPPDSTIHILTAPLPGAAK